MLENYLIILTDLNSLKLKLMIIKLLKLKINHCFEGLVEYISWAKLIIISQYYVLIYIYYIF